MLSCRDKHYVVEKANNTQFLTGQRAGDTRDAPSQARPVRRGSGGAPAPA